MKLPFLIHNRAIAPTKLNRAISKYHEEQLERMERYCREYQSNVARIEARNSSLQRLSTNLQQLAGVRNTIRHEEERILELVKRQAQAHHKYGALEVQYETFLGNGKQQGLIQLLSKRLDQLRCSWEKAKGKRGILKGSSSDKKTVQDLFNSWDLSSLSDQMSQKRSQWCRNWRDGFDQKLASRRALTNQWKERLKEGLAERARISGQLRIPDDS